MRTKTAQPSSVRKPLSSLETNTRDKENVVVGLGSSSTIKGGITKGILKEKDHPPRKENDDIKDYKDVQNASAQTDFEYRIDANDLISTDPPGEEYWKMVAHHRLKALEETLKENEELHTKVIALQKQKRAYQQMLDETTALVNVLQEMIGQEDEDN